MIRGGCDRSHSVLDRLRAERAGLDGDATQSIDVDVDQMQMAAGLRQMQRDGPPDPGGRPGHERPFVAKVPHRLLPSAASL